METTPDHECEGEVPTFHAFVDESFCVLLNRGDRDAVAVWRLVNLKGGRLFVAPGVARTLQSLDVPLPTGCREVARQEYADDELIERCVRDIQATKVPGVDLSEPRIEWGIRALVEATACIESTGITDDEIDSDHIVFVTGDAYLVAMMCTETADLAVASTCTRYLGTKMIAGVCVKDIAPVDVDGHTRWDPHPGLKVLGCGKCLEHHPIEFRWDA